MTLTISCIQNDTRISAGLKYSSLLCETSVFSVVHLFNPTDLPAFPASGVVKINHREHRESHREGVIGLLAHNCGEVREKGIISYYS